MVVQVVWNDQHVPYYDPKIVDMFAEFLQGVRPDEIHYLGDWLDCWSISTKYRRVAKDERVNRVKFEREVGCELLFRFRDLCPKATHVFHEGNHENRLTRYVAEECPALYGIEELTTP
ncbi:MAG: hypothetical protein WBC05_13395, partial [Sedimentisphaerales bacterium]